MQNLRLNLIVLKTLIVFKMIIFTSAGSDLLMLEVTINN